MVDGFVVNFEELLRDATWSYWPIDEACVCGTSRSAIVWLRPEDSLWAKDSKYGYDASKPEGERHFTIPDEERKWKRFGAFVRLTQHNGCSGFRHRFHISLHKGDLPMQKRWPSDIYEEHPISIYPQVGRRVKYGYFRQEIYLPYGFNPHERKVVEYVRDADRDRLSGIYFSDSDLYKSVDELREAEVRSEVKSYEKWMKVDWDPTENRDET
jgi:hypothetical protein